VPASVKADTAKFVVEHIIGKARSPWTSTRTTDGADRIVRDGPYAETKEHLGGYYLLDVANLDEALHWARQLPLRPGFTVEVRPMLAPGRPA
jgi:hypothetical protein